MIPKIIHYCWFGRNPLPPLAIKCIGSWKKFLPDYEIKEWNEDNFDVNMIPYTVQAYVAKKYAFVSDYARFWILYHYGGVYFDTDVELIKPIDDILENGSFMGVQAHCKGYLCGEKVPHLNITVNPGLGIAAEKSHPIYKDLLDLYNNLRFPMGKEPPKTIVYYTTKILSNYGLEKDRDSIQCIKGIYIYPEDYFNPISIVTEHMHITNNTRSVHWFVASWKKCTFKEKLKRLLRKAIPEPILLMYHDYKFSH